MEYLSLFSMPTPMKITGRSSSITNAFINAITPIIPPTKDEVREALVKLGMTPATFQCSYCGDSATEWDHLRPLVKDKQPTGFISEIRNLVPCCGKCNQSKGNSHWRAWMYGAAPRSPSTRKIADLEERVQRLTDYENWGEPTKLDYEAIVGMETWKQHWKNRDQVKAAMDTSQTLAADIQKTVYMALRSA